jgi:mono/diheme cytochrome c family protein
MPGFGRETFSDEDIADVVAYLKQVAFEKTHAE